MGGPPTVARNPDFGVDPAPDQEATSTPSEEAHAYRPKSAHFFKSSIPAESAAALLRFSNRVHPPFLVSLSDWTSFNHRRGLHLKQFSLWLTFK